MPDVPKHQKKAVITLNAEIVKYFEDKRGLFKKKAGERVKYFEEVFCRKLRDMFDQQHNPAPLTRAPLQLIHSVNNDDDNDDDYLD